MTLVEAIYLFLAYVVLALAVDKLPFIPIVKKVSGLSADSLKTMQSKDLDDSQKEAMLLANSSAMFKNSLKLFGLVILLAGFTFLLMLPIVFLKPISIHSLLEHMGTYLGLGLAVGSFIFYFVFKKIYVKIRL